MNTYETYNLISAIASLISMSIACYMLWRLRKNIFSIIIGLKNSVYKALINFIADISNAVRGQKL